MLAKELLSRVDIIKIIGNPDLFVSKVVFDSREAVADSMFIAISGNKLDGNQYINDAILNGSSVIVTEDIKVEIEPDITYVYVKNSRKTLSTIASNFYGNPSKKINLVGVTGTNGKTTIVNLLYQFFVLNDIKVGMLSTISNIIDNKIIAATHTTADPLQINFLINQMVEQGCKYCFMEVSSHAIDQYRIHDLDFNAGIFTNITRDHLDYHKTFSNYINVKKSFFDCLKKNAISIVNKDDKNGLKMIESSESKKITYSIKSSANYSFNILEYHFSGTLVKNCSTEFWINLVGEFNVYNILAVFSLAQEYGFKKETILKNLTLLKSAEGRFQLVRSKDSVTGIIDYAHTDDALKNLLKTINKIRNLDEELIVVFGCGGERDKSKRLLMTAVACDLSNQVILTSDNPRGESLDSIISDMTDGLDPLQKEKILIISDRKEAINTAARLAKSKDIIVLAGKGHETYQEINGNQIPFNDKNELKKALKII